METTGFGLRFVVHAADIADRDGARVLLAGQAERVPRLAHRWVDTSYQGPCGEWITATLRWPVDVVRKPRRWVGWPAEEPPPMPAGFPVLPRRWVVERTFGWLGRCRRLSQDIEGLAVAGGNASSRDPSGSRMPRSWHTAALEPLASAEDETLDGA